MDSQRNVSTDFDTVNSLHSKYITKFVYLIIEKETKRMGIFDFHILSSFKKHIRLYTQAVIMHAEQTCHTR